MNDIYGAIQFWLTSQSAVSDLVDDRVYLNRLPRDVIEKQDTFHPKKMIVIQMAGGKGTSDFRDLDRPNINVLCYGETDLEADKVRREMWKAFKNLTREWINDVLIHHVNPISGVIVSRDPDIKWPILTQSFSILAATEKAT